MQVKLRISEIHHGQHIGVSAFGHTDVDAETLQNALVSMLETAIADLRNFPDSPFWREYLRPD